jgi:hypothetical protein
MEPTQLQLVLNVVTITGMTSLAGYCFLLKKENRKLATQHSEPRSDDPEAEAVQPAVHFQNPAPSEEPAFAADLDIRTLASARRARWVKGLASSIS